MHFLLVLVFYRNVVVYLFIYLFIFLLLLKGLTVYHFL